MAAGSPLAPANLSVETILKCVVLLDGLSLGPHKGPFCAPTACDMGSQLHSELGQLLGSLGELAGEKIVRVDFLFKGDSIICRRLEDE